MKNNMKKCLLTAALVFTMVCLLASCGGKQTKVSVKIVSPDTNILYSDPVLVTDNNPTAAKAVIQACKDNKIAYNVKDGMFDGFGGVESTKEDGWLLYLNGTLAQTGAEATQIKEGDAVEFRYENYDKAFSQPSSDYIGKWRGETDTDGSAAFLTIEEDEASFTYIDQERTTTSYTGTYTIVNDQIIINDLASNSPVTIPFEMKDGKMILTYNAKPIPLTKQ